MSSKSKNSYASKLALFKKFSENLEEVPGYISPIKMAGLPEFLKNIASANVIMDNHSKQEIITKKLTDKRQNLYDGKIDSLTTRLTLISKFVRALKGKDDIHYIRISKLVRHIRGASKKRKTLPTDINTKTISQIERTFGSRWADLGTIIITLESLGKEYNPPNTQITIAALKALQLEIETTNSKTEREIAKLKPIITKRQTLFKTLAKQNIMIKQFVRAQFGSKSEHYIKLNSIA